jgi:pyridoxine 5-phosphate synthase
MVTLVPEKKEEITTEGGLDLTANFDNLSQIISKLQINDMFVSLFINPEIESIKQAAKLRADFVELNTDSYAQAKKFSQKVGELERIEKMVGLAYKLGLRVNAGHGLGYGNISDLVIIEHIEEFSIGHSIVARSVLVGFERAVREMLQLVKKRM